MMTHSDYDSYRRQKGLNWSEYYDQTAHIPMIHISGWFDAYCGPAIDNYVSRTEPTKRISLSKEPSLNLSISGGKLHSVRSSAAGLAIGKPAARQIAALIATISRSALSGRKSRRSSPQRHLCTAGPRLGARVRDSSPRKMIVELVLAGEVAASRPAGSPVQCVARHRQM